MRERDWMRPALNRSEAVLMPALGRTRERLFSDRMGRRESADTFVPLPMEQQTTALSTYVRPRGSMAGRGVLKAAGVSLSPYAAPRRETSGVGFLRRFLAR